ncbi:hypothetical protein SNK03_011500 [Fusarium graminearum]|uniref:Chromosome 3, complete genome n=2 Tax=Gibberella zeae TaxID=5518 RepID=I1RNF6_GIBZE|nr:hypothetical protein FGSG_05532 [Fusarium graminearum PH-1]EYB26206.1 hypothetical protein FG05_05532 [Fusarium graminearum]ESU11504.1 hypothetical protein FGSG_05532 [Fusarium graminearum PH-1]KAI6757213.1 hypothetical protein HG531_003038 [Fusarium graminearum]PCD40409.1 hypothetical protein FGRA07_01680 [Fusarium graminearum]CAF3522913.1 unnamed protein product [Fusarium graminearum]|eukprot:XP_011324080.1 hypothetical protein FGSG_05532 [Fusarium graminearum PH-1]
MARSLGAHDDIAIAEIVVYTFLLFGALFLCKTHGFSRNSGWFYIIILSLARLIGSSMLLATINDPDNTNLYIGWIVLNGLGLGPLILIMLGLLDRLFNTIKSQGGAGINVLYQRAVHLLMLVAVILISVGGASSNYTLDGASPTIKYSTESKVGVSLMIVVLVLVIGQFLFALRNQSYIVDGERRILIAVGASLPFVIVRLAYTCTLILGGHKQDVWIYLGAGVIMEIVVVIICEAIGFTLNKVHKPVVSEEAANKATSGA